jgi:hypothetical protein
VIGFVDADLPAPYRVETMQRVRFRFVAVAVMVFAWAWPLAAPASAQGKTSAGASTATPQPSAEARERARTAYREGQKAFGVAKFADAASAFEAAFAAVPNPVVLLSLSESRAKNGQIPEAIAALKKYLELRTDAPDRADVQRRIQSLDAKPAFLATTSEPADADVELDGSPMFRTPVQLELKPGSHDIRCTRPGYRAHTYTVVAVPGSRQTLFCQLEVLPPTPRIAPLEGSGAPEAATGEGGLTPIPSGRPMAAIWITGGIGTAALINSAVFGLLAVKAHRDFDGHPTTAAADRGERFAMIADIGFGVGVVALATAASIYLLTDAAPCDASTAAEPVLIRF